MNCASCPVLALLTFTLCMYVVNAVLQSRGQSGETVAAHDFGVVYVQLYVHITAEGKHKTAQLNVWLKRGGADHKARADDRPHLLPWQLEPSVTGFAWVEDLDHLDKRFVGHVAMSVDANAWRPSLRLETGAGTTVASTPAHPDGLSHANTSPFSFTFRLSAEEALSHCFKIYEASVPGYKAPLCLPAPSAALCNGLAPAPTPAPAPSSSSSPSASPSTSPSPSAPALWAVLGPFRSVGLNGSAWGQHLSDTAARLANYAAHHVEALGAAGVLLYADRYTQRGLARQRPVAALLRSGRLVVVRWELLERSPLFYNYDQALVASHALLGLSSCGTNLQLLIADIDEYLYSVRGLSWPDMHACMRAAALAEPPGAVGRQGRSNGSAAATPGPAAELEAGAAGDEAGTSVRALLRAAKEAEGAEGVEEDGNSSDADDTTESSAASSLNAQGPKSQQQQRQQADSTPGALSVLAGQAEPGVYQLFRIDVTASKLDPAAEERLWATPAPAPGRHPLLLYDRIGRTAHKSYHGKCLTVPATRLVAYFVHEGWPLHGSAHMADARCAFMLHVVNYWVPRASVENARRDFEPFRLQLPYVHYSQQQLQQTMQQQQQLRRQQQRGRHSRKGGDAAAVADAAARL